MRYKIIKGEQSKQSLLYCQKKKKLATSATDLIYHISVHSVAQDLPEAIIVYVLSVVAVLDFIELKLLVIIFELHFS